MLNAARRFSTSQCNNPPKIKVYAMGRRETKILSNGLEYHRIRTGEWVLLPPNPTTSFSANQVVAYGEKAVIFEKVENEIDREREQNKHAYLRLRKYHLEYAEGKWCSVAGNGNLVMFSDNPSTLYQSLFTARNMTTDFNVSAAYTDCIGRECLVQYEFDGFDIVDDVATVPSRKGNGRKDNSL